MLIGRHVVDCLQQLIRVDAHVALFCPFELVEKFLRERGYAHELRRRYRKTRKGKLIFASWPVRLGLGLGLGSRLNLGFGIGIDLWFGLGSRLNLGLRFGLGLGFELGNRARRRVVP